MVGTDAQSTVANRKVDEDKRKRRRSATWDDRLDARLNALAARTPLDKTQIVEACILRMLATFEADPGEMLRQGE